MNHLKNLLIAYAPEGDLLAMGNGSWANGGGANITSGTLLTAFYAESGQPECIGFDLFDAAVTLAPYLNGELTKGAAFDGELTVSYCQETDTLMLLSNREPAAHTQHVANGLVAHCNKSGQAIGFTLKNAAQRLLPHLKKRKTKTGAVS